MTCIVGIVHENKTWIGADSCISDGNSRQSTSTPKLFKIGGYLIGAAGHAGWFAVLKKIRWPSVASPGYMNSGFVTDLLNAGRESGIQMPAEIDAPGDGAALVGGSGKLWYIDSSLWSAEYQETACGSGGEGARCVLHVRKGTPKTRILSALEAVSSVRFDVAPPFVVDSI